jgi:hypothetical protein
MNILGRHVALDQQEYFFPAGLMHSHIHNQYRMAGKTALDKHIPDPHLFNIQNRFQLILQRMTAGIHENGIQVFPEIPVTMVNSGGPDPADPVSPDPGPESPGPIPEPGRITTGEIKHNIIKESTEIKIFSPQADDGIRALLQIPWAHVNIQHSRMGVLIRFAGSIME